MNNVSIQYWTQLLYIHPLFQVQYNVLLRCVGERRIIIFNGSLHLSCLAMSLIRHGTDLLTIRDEQQEWSHWSRQQIIWWYTCCIDSNMPYIYIQLLFVIRMYPIITDYGNVVRLCANLMMLISRVYYITGLL